MIKVISIAALSIGIGACALSVDAVASDTSAQQPSEGETPELAAAGAPENASPDYDPNEVICRREKEAGSNFYRKTCFTRAQLDARAEQDQEALRQMRSMRSGSQSETNPGGG